jgi:hypothetical protein
MIRVAWLIVILLSSDKHYSFEWYSHECHSEKCLYTKSRDILFKFNLFLASLFHFLLSVILLRVIIPNARSPSEGEGSVQLASCTNRFRSSAFNTNTHFSFF